MNHLQAIYDSVLRKTDPFAIPLGPFFFSSLICRAAKRTFWYIISGWKHGQTDTCAQHTFVFPALDLRSTAELWKESNRKTALQQMVLLKELRWNSLCYKCSLVFSETPIGSGSPAGLLSNVQSQMTAEGCTHIHTLLYLMNGFTCLLLLTYSTSRAPVRANKLSLELFCNQIEIMVLVIWHFGDFFSLINSENGDTNSHNSYDSMQWKIICSNCMYIVILSHAITLKCHVSWVLPCCY